MSAIRLMLEHYAALVASSQGSLENPYCLVGLSIAEMEECGFKTERQLCAGSPKRWEQNGG